MMKLLVMFAALAVTGLAVTGDGVRLATLERTDGRQVDGRIEVLNTDAVLFESEGQPVERLPRSEVRKVEFDRTATPAPALVTLTAADSEIRHDEITFDGKQFALSRAGQTIPVPASLVRAVRFVNLSESEAELWQELLGKQEAEDLLVIRRSSGSVDYLKGQVGPIDADTVRFNFQGSEIPVPRSRAAGIILAGAQQDFPDPRAILTLADGSRWSLNVMNLGADAEDCLIQTCGGIETRLPLREIVTVQFPVLGVTRLADLQPELAQVTPYFGSRQIEGILQQWFQPTPAGPTDRGSVVIFDPTAADEQLPVESGLQVTSRTELLYRLAGQYRRFQATVGFEPLAGVAGNVRLRLLDVGSNSRSDWDKSSRVLLDRPIGTDHEPVRVDVDVSAVNRLAIVVDYGSGFDLGDQVILGDARLMK